MRHPRQPPPRAYGPGQEQRITFARWVKSRSQLLHHDDSAESCFIIMIMQVHHAEILQNLGCNSDHQSDTDGQTIKDEGTEDKH